MTRSKNLVGISLVSAALLLAPVRFSIASRADMGPSLTLWSTASTASADDDENKKRSRQHDERRVEATPTPVTVPFTLGTETVTILPPPRRNLAGASVGIDGPGLVDSGEAQKSEPNAIARYVGSAGGFGPGSASAEACRSFADAANAIVDQQEQDVIDNKDATVSDGVIDGILGAGQAFGCVFTHD
jgi:hypothetical protein